MVSEYQSQFPYLSSYSYNIYWSGAESVHYVRAPVVYKIDSLLKQLPHMSRLEHAIQFWQKDLSVYEMLGCI